MEDSEKDDTRQCLVYPLITNSIFSSNCNGEFFPITKLRNQFGTKQSEMAVILDRCGIFDEDQTKFVIIPDQQICEHHRKIMYKKFKNIYIRREKCMWKNHKKVDPRRRKINLNKVTRRFQGKLFFSRNF